MPLPNDKAAIHIAIACLWLAIFLFLTLAVLSVRGKIILPTDERMYGASVDQDGFSILLKYNIQAAIVRKADINKYENCLKNIQNEDDIKKLTIILVSMENYVRPPWIRKIELWIAKYLYRFIGIDKDPSLGIGQIKLSTVRNLIEKGIIQGDFRTDSDIIKLLEDDCENIRIAFAYTRYLADIYQESELKVIESYNGQSAVAHSEKELGSSFYNQIALELFLLAFRTTSLDEFKESTKYLPRGDIW